MTITDLMHYLSYVEKYASNAEVKLGEMQATIQGVLEMVQQIRRGLMPGSELAVEVHKVTHTAPVSKESTSTGKGRL